MEFTDLVQANTLLNPGISAAVGAAVSLKARGDAPRQFVGVVVEVTEDRKAVWAHRAFDVADSVVWFSVRELDLATERELAEVGRRVLNQQRYAVLEAAAAANS